MKEFIKVVSKKSQKDDGTTFFPLGLFDSSDNSVSHITPVVKANNLCTMQTLIYSLANLYLQVKM